MSAPTITPFILGEFQTNCFVVTVSGQSSCWIVDCGFEPDALLDWIAGHDLHPAALLLTHAHADHIAGVDRALSRFGPLPTSIHRAEAGFCSDPLKNLSVFLEQPVSVTEPDHLLDDGDELQLASTRWRVVHAPGHSPGGALFIHDESRQAIVGDTLFAGSIGRFDFPTSDPGQLRHTIQHVLMALPDDMTIYPGHGPSTTIGHERRANPFVLQGF